MERMAEVVTRLIQLQGDRSDGEMAALLGCTRSHWAHIKAGRRQLTYSRLKHAVRAFPGLWPDVMQDLSGPDERAVPA